MSAELFVAMLAQLMRHRKNPLFLILDSLPAHKAKAVQNCVKSTGGKLELYFLPGCAPELNPDERVWNYMKPTGTAKRPLTQGQRLQNRVEADLLVIQNNPARVRAFFRTPDVAYVTDG